MRSTASLCPWPPRLHTSFMCGSGGRHVALLRNCYQRPGGDSLLALHLRSLSDAQADTKCWRVLTRPGRVAGMPVRTRAACKVPLPFDVQRLSSMAPALPRLDHFAASQAKIAAPLAAGPSGDPDSQALIFSTRGRSSSGRRPRGWHGAAFPAFADEGWKCPVRAGRCRCRLYASDRETVSGLTSARLSISSCTCSFGSLPHHHPLSPGGRRRRFGGLGATIAARSCLADSERSHVYAAPSTESCAPWPSP